MAAEGRWLLLQNLCCIIDCFERASIEINMTKQTDFNSDMYISTDWYVNSATVVGWMASTSPLCNYRLWKTPKFQYKEFPNIGL